MILSGTLATMMDCFNNCIVPCCEIVHTETSRLMMADNDWLTLSSASPGWQILAEKEEEQLGCKTFPRCSQVKGEPNHCESSFSGAWECSTADRGCRATEGMRPLQELCQPLRIQIWEVVRDWIAESGNCKMDVNTEDLSFTLSSYVAVD